MHPVSMMIVSVLISFFGLLMVGAWAHAWFTQRGDHMLWAFEWLAVTMIVQLRGPWPTDVRVAVGLAGMVVAMGCVPVALRRRRARRDLEVTAPVTAPSQRRLAAVPEPTPVRRAA